MNTIEITRAMNKVPGFVGCFARDQLPIRTKRPAGLIFNTDPSTKSGTHWIAYYISGDGQSELFDPLGKPIAHNEIFEFVKRNGPPGWPSTVCNSIAYQSDSSSKCGQFCIFYLKRRLRGSSICEIYASLSQDADVNESIV